jgi:hypothetical protein
MTRTPLSKTHSSRIQFTNFGSQDFESVSSDEGVYHRQSLGFLKASCSSILNGRQKKERRSVGLALEWSGVKEISRPTVSARITLLAWTLTEMDPCKSHDILPSVIITGGYERKLLGEGRACD